MNRQISADEYCDQATYSPVLAGVGVSRSRWLTILVFPFFLANINTSVA